MEQPEILGRKAVFPIVYSVCLGVSGKGLLFARPPFPRPQMRGLTDTFGVLCTCENYRELLVNNVYLHLCKRHRIPVNLCLSIHLSTRLTAPICPLGSLLLCAAPSAAGCSHCMNPSTASDSHLSCCAYWLSPARLAPTPQGSLHAGSRVSLGTSSRGCGCQEIHIHLVSKSCAYYLTS